MTPPHGYGPFWKRVVAALVDGVLVTLSFFVLGVTMLFLIVIAGQFGFSGLANFILRAATIWLYFALFESSKLQATPGKLLMDLQVRDLTGVRIGFWQATIRVAAKLISAIPVGLGFVLPLFNDQRRALHDRMAGTVVVNRG